MDERVVEQIMRALREGHMLVSSWERSYDPLGGSIYRIELVGRLPYPDVVPAKVEFEVKLPEAREDKDLFNQILEDDLENEDE